MKTFGKEFEIGNLFVQIYNCEVSFNVIIFVKDYNLLWFRIGKLGKYKQLDICGKRVYSKHKKSFKI